MDKSILTEYVDACALVRETEAEIRRLEIKQRRILQDRVRRSNPEFPYEEQSVHIEGVDFSGDDDSSLRWQKRILEQRKKNAERIRHEAEEFINTASPRMQRIINYKIMQGMTWEEVAARIGRKATGDSVKKEFQRFMEKN